MSRLLGLAPVLDANTRVLVLGSGDAAVAAQTKLRVQQFLQAPKCVRMKPA